MLPFSNLIVMIFIMFIVRNKLSVHTLLMFIASYPDNMFLGHLERLRSGAKFLAFKIYVTAGWRNGSVV